MHIEKIQLQKFQRGELETTEYIKVLEHVATCTFCANELANMELENAVVTAPKNLKSQILQRSKAPDVQIVAGAKKTSKKVQLMLYGAKTVTAVIIALFLLNLVSKAGTQVYEAQPYDMQNIAATQQSESISSQISDGISQGSQAVLNCINKISNNILSGGK